MLCGPPPLRLEPKNPLKDRTSVRYTLQSVAILSSEKGDVMETFTKVSDSVQSSIIESIRLFGDYAARTARTVREQTDRLVPSIPGLAAFEALPSPLDVTESAFDFTTKILEAQHDAVTAFVGALTEVPPEEAKPKAAKKS